MGTGWRRAFCTSIPKNSNQKTTTNTKNNPNSTPKLGFTKFNLFTSSSAPSTPRSQAPVPELKPQNLRCKTTPVKESQTLDTNLKYNKNATPTARSAPTTTTSSPLTPSSPHSPSTFALLLKNSLRLTKQTRCGVCLHNVKTGQGTAIFTAECSHTFHFPCIASLASKNNGVLICCPLCGSQWKEAPYLPVKNNKLSSNSNSNSNKSTLPNDLRLYDDDEPLAACTAAIRFNPILESEEENGEEEDNDEFPGFFADPLTPRHQITDANSRGVKVSISTESAVIAVGRSYETYAVVLTVKAPPFTARIRRRSVDVVVVLDVGSEMNDVKLGAMKRAMRGMICSLNSNDRLSMVVFSSHTKRLLPLRRMTPSGKRSARRIIDAINLSSEGCSLNDALRKAAKVVQDRKEKNQFASIVILHGRDEDNEYVGVKNPCFGSSIRFSEIPVHSYKLKESFSEEEFVKSVNAFLSVVVLDVRVQFGLACGSAKAEIAAVYSCTGRPCLLNSGAAKLGDLYSSEEREIMVELRVPAASIGSHHMLSVRSYHKDPSNGKQVIYGGDQSLIVPRPHTIRSSDPKIQRLRGLFVMTRAVAESRRLLTERNDFIGAERLLGSARAVLSQPGLRITAADEFRKRVDAELAEVKWRRQGQDQSQSEEKQKREKDGNVRGGSGGGGGGCCVVDEKGEPLTPTSAWKAAERLAKVAMMRKNLNRVSDLHGFEDARF